MEQTSLYRALPRAATTLVALGFLASASPALSTAFVDQGSSTLDTNTGLEWLDVTLTDDKSVDDFLSGYGGYLAAGYHVATWSEVDMLVQDAGFPGLGPYNPQAIYYPAASTLVSLLGPTYGDGGNQSGIQGLAYYGGSYRDPQVGWINESGTLKGYTTDCCGFYGSSAHFANVGLYLVRAVPEPATWMMMLLGFAAIAMTIRAAPRRVPEIMQIA